ncbi:hypothetical protein HOLleu_32031 [Holothuria leucospilota]|uniref:Zinc finger PHD-type domain-containing protein n=1 Tax=Holothuria leucospilota TaxID=206669 RepID=A0A9Q1BIE4_HOLLE|nr:hypothetical protein HOLleu_32031 [Holothuria leucospilota]
MPKGSLSRRFVMSELLSLLKKWKARLTEGYRRSDSVWGDIAIALKIKNSPANRKNLYSLWRKKGQNASNETEDEPEQSSHEYSPDHLFCHCRTKNTSTLPYVKCERCKEWFHFTCGDYSDTQTSRNIPYICSTCHDGLRRGRDADNTIHASLTMRVSSSSNKDSKKVGTDYSGEKMKHKDDSITRTPLLTEPTNEAISLTRNTDASGVDQLSDEMGEHYDMFNDEIHGDYITPNVEKRDDYGTSTSQPTLATDTITKPVARENASNIDKLRGEMGEQTETMTAGTEDIYSPTDEYYDLYNDELEANYDSRDNNDPKADTPKPTASEDEFQTSKQNHNSEEELSEDMNMYSPTRKFDDASDPMNESSGTSDATEITLSSIHYHQVPEHNNEEGGFQKKSSSSSFNYHSSSESFTNTAKSKTKGKFRRIRKHKKGFSFTLDRKEWKSLSPKSGAKGLRKGWTQTMAEKFGKTNKTCVLAFKHQHVKKPSSQKRKSPYWKATALCKFSDCCQYTFEIMRRPNVKDKLVKVIVQRQGQIKHSRNETHKRDTVGKERECIAKDLKRDGTSNWYYQRMFNLNATSKEAGNVNKPKTLQVLHQILSQERKRLNLSPDVLQEVKLLQEIYKELDNESTMPGYIQYFSCEPFKTILFTEKQLRLYLADKGRILYLDATGSIVQKIPGNPKPVFYYALVMKSPLKGKGAIPVAEMLSNDQHASEVCHFLMRLVNSLKSLSGGNISPRRIEIDNSWVMLTSVLQAFNQEDVRAYLRGCWQILACGTRAPRKTYPHMCSAHIIHQMSRTLSKLKLTKRLSQMTLYAFALLIEATSLQEGTEIFQHVCCLLGTPTITDDVEKSTRVLTKLMEQESQLKSEIDKDHTISEMDNTGFKQGTIKETSPFFQHFMSLWLDRQAKNSKGGNSGPINSTHKPEIIEVMLNSMMHLFPLWSGAMLGDLQRHTPESAKYTALKPDTLKHATNNLVETFFEKVKKDQVPIRGNRLRAGMFIRSEFISVMGHINEISTYIPTSSTHESTKRGKKRVSEEKWSRRKKQRKAKYFSKTSTPLSNENEEITNDQDQSLFQPKGIKPGAHSDKSLPMTPKRQKQGTTEYQHHLPDNTNHFLDDAECNHQTAATGKEYPSEREAARQSASHTQQTIHLRNEPLREHANTIPQWGGDAQFMGARVFMDNTCPIDNLLYIFYRISTERPDIYEVVCQNHTSKVGRYLTQLKILVANGEWTFAKLIWLSEFCGFQVKQEELNAHVVWNVYGSEYDRVVKHLRDIQSSEQTSRCSSPSCPSAVRTARCCDVSLMEEGKNRCSGYRMWNSRKFTFFNGRPPFLVFTPTYTDGKELKSVPCDQQLRIGNLM